MGRVKHIDENNPILNSIRQNVEKGLKTSRICYTNPDRPALSSWRQKIRNRQRRPDAAVRHTPGKDSQILPRSFPPPGGPQFQGQPSGRLANAGQPSASVALRYDADGVVGCRDMQTASKRPYRVTVARMTPVSSPAKTNMIMPVPVPMRKGGSAFNLNPIRPA